jgi:hypothetical protein
MDQADLHRHLSLAHAEALRVGDSPLAADQLANRLPAIVRAVEQSELGEDTRKRIRDALGTAERVLRRDDDGREAARHIHTAIGLLGPRPRKPSPFGDDPEE